MTMFGLLVFLSDALCDGGSSLTEKESRTESWREKRGGLYLILGLSLSTHTAGVG